jgi:hypothetical protein
MYSAGSLGMVAVVVATHEGLIPLSEDTACNIHAGCARRTSCDVLLQMLAMHKHQCGAASSSAFKMEVADQDFENVDVDVDVNDLRRALLLLFLFDISTDSSN